jgi:C4-dicarboxylate-specific signal transduction histidine kinase
VIQITTHNLENHWVPLRGPPCSPELEELVDSFPRTHERLKLAVDEWNETQQTLESKVDEPTQQLQTAERKPIPADRLASLGQLAARVAHEINDPVSGALPLSMLLERFIPARDSQLLS